MGVTERAVLAAERDALIRVGDEIHTILTRPSTRTQLAVAIHEYLNEKTVEAMTAVRRHDREQTS